jgi:hypothetical protein
MAGTKAMIKEYVMAFARREIELLRIPLMKKRPTSYKGTPRNPGSTILRERLTRGNTKTLYACLSNCSMNPVIFFRNFIDQE